MRRRRNTLDEDLRRLEREVRDSDFQDSTLVERYLRALERSGKITTEESELLSSFGADAQRAYFTGAEWEMSDYLGEIGDEWPSYCDDCTPDTWHRSWITDRYTIAEGHIIRAWYAHDSDGDSYFLDEADINDEAAIEENERRYGEDARREVVREYLGWVIAEGRDPLDWMSETEADAIREAARRELLSLGDS